MFEAGELDLELDFPAYLEDKATFETDFRLLAVKIFAYHELAVTFAPTLHDIHSLWVNVANEWSMRIPTKVGDALCDRSSPDPLVLSHIKHAGILSYSIAKCRPIATLTPASDEQIASLVLDRKIPFGGAHEDPLCCTGLKAGESPTLEDPCVHLAFPHEMLALTIVDALFMRYQLSREEQMRRVAHKPNRQRHMYENLCIALEGGKLTPEAMYLLYKTQDLYMLDGN